MLDGLDPKALRGLVDEAKARVGSGVVALVAVNDGRATVAVGVTDDLTASRNAVDLVRKAVEAVGGQGGGGRPDMAQGGGPDGGKAADGAAGGPRRAQRGAGCRLSVAQPPAELRRLLLELAHLHDLLAQLGALLVDRGDHRAHRHAEIDQHRLRKLQRGFERLGHRVGRAGPVELGGMRRIAGAGDDGEIGAPAAHPLGQPHRLAPDRPWSGSARWHGRG